MRRLYKKIIALHFMFISTMTMAQTSGTLTITASNLKDEKGKAVFELFKKDDDLPEKPFMKLSGCIVNGKSQVAFQNLPYGQYAVILFHDENENGILDHKWGFPNEPMGFSNDWKLTLFSGMPTFEKLKFSFTEKKKTYDIKIK